MRSPWVEPRIGGVDQAQASKKPKLRTNPNFGQTQTLNKSGLRGT